MKPLKQQEVKQLKQLLRERQADLELQLAENEDQSDTVELDQQLMGRVSRIDAIQQQSMAAANRIIQQKQLNSIVRVLNTISKGDYGHCKECDEPIGFERLKIKPEAELCITCQANAE